MKNTLAIVAMLLSACSYEYPPGGEDSYEPSWDGMQLFFKERCSNCHGYAPGAGGVQLPEDLIADRRDETGELVVPGEPEASFLLQILESGIMPAGNRPLPVEMTAHVRTWITSGAEIP